jgi:hypothetical protein
MLNYTIDELKTIKTLNDLKHNKNAVLVDLYNTYISTTKATHTLIGFTYNGVLYSIKIRELPVELVRLTTESKGGIKLKMQVGKAQKAQWIASGKATKLMSEEKFTEMVKNSKYNKGEILEKIVTEKRGLEWKKDSVRYDKAGDIDLKRDRIQVKFENASLTSAYTMYRVVNGI